MSTLEDLDDLEREQKEDKKDDGDKEKKPDQNGDAEMKDAEPEDPIDEEIYNLSTQDILTRKRLLENDSRIMKSEFQRLSHEKATMGEKIKDNLDKIENNRYIYLCLCGAYSRLIYLQAITIPRWQCR
jgi:26S proteasome regulatory subunit T5